MRCKEAILASGSDSYLSEIEILYSVEPVMDTSALLYAVGAPLISAVLGWLCAGTSGSILRLLIITLCITVFIVLYVLYFEFGIILSVIGWGVSVIFLDLSWLARFIVNDKRAHSAERDRKSPGKVQARLTVR